MQIENVKHKGLALAVLATGQLMVILDATIVNVALPAIQKLGFSNDAQLQWVVTAYALSFGGFLLLGGRLADLFGRRRIFLSGVILFATASLIGGLSQSPGMLITLRTIQGLGGALLAPSALSLLLNIFKEGPERNRAVGVWSMVAGGGGAVGLLLGGVLTQYANWRWIFFINVPVAICVVLAARHYLPEAADKEKQRVDYAGAITVTASLMSLVYALAEAAQDGWSSKVTIVSFVLSAILMIAFIVNELRIKHPLITLGIFKRRNVTGGTLLGLLMSAGMFGMFFYLSIYLQQILRYSPTKTGAADVPFTIVLVAVAGVLAGRVAKLNPKPILVISPLIMAVGLLYFAKIPLHANYISDILPGMVLMAIGMAMFFVTNTIATTTGSSQKESGLISGLLNIGQQIGGAVGLAVLSVVSTTVTKNDIVAAHGAASAIPLATVHGFQRGFAVSIVFAILSSLIALFLLKTHKPTAAEAAGEEVSEAEAMPAVPGA